MGGWGIGSRIQGIANGHLMGCQGNWNTFNNVRTKYRNSSVSPQFRADAYSGLVDHVER